MSNGKISLGHVQLVRREQWLVVEAMEIADNEWIEVARIHAGLIKHQDDRAHFVKAVCDVVAMSMARCRGMDNPEVEELEFSFSSKN